MRKLANGALVVLLAMMLVLSACSSGNNNSDKNAANNANTNANADKNANKEEDDGLPKKDLTDEITIWTFSDKMFQEVAKEFNKVYPNIKVNVVVMPFDELHNKLQTTLAAGTGAPDMASVEQGQFPRYTTGGVLQDLLAAPFNAGRYQNDQSEYNWERWKSIDGSQLLGFPWDITPGVTYYRSDIMDELGLPSDPDELGEYMQDPENFFNLVQTLAANGKFTMEWRDSLIHYFGDQYGYFDKDLNWVRTGDDYVKYLDYAKRANALKIAPHDGYLSDKGKQRVKKGEQVMVMLGSWGARDIRANFPELSGKWRVTKLPLGLNVGMGGSAWVMPAQSKHKEATWAFMNFASRSEQAWKIWTKSEYSVEPSWKSITQLPWYLEHTNDYLGGQEDFKFYDTLTDAIPVRRLTRIDGKAWGIWLDGVLKALDKNIDSKTAIQQIQDNIQRQMKPDIDQLKKDMQIQLQQ